MPSAPPAAAPDESELRQLRAEVRRFLTDEQDAGTFTPGVDTWLTGWDAEFSRRLAARGWLGMTIPRAYGGHERSFVERFVITEELLAAGAPIAAHWIADRQIAPSLLRFGSEPQKQELLPRIARGELFFGIGMSEPESGSDLASVRTRGERVAGGWLLNGRKTWTSGAHVADAFFALARTAPLDTSNRHAGLSQFIVDLRAEGVTVEPIVSMNGRHHFNEVTFDDVFIADENVLGTIGEGWQQVTSELAFERSGPERFLSTFPLLDSILRLSTSADTHRSLRGHVGQHIARLSALHHLSLGVATALQESRHADVEAAEVKLLGTREEGDLAELIDHHLGGIPATQVPTPTRDLLDTALTQRPGFTLRGGTNEVLRGVIARSLGLR